MSKMTWRRRGLWMVVLLGMALGAAWAWLRPPAALALSQEAYIWQMLWQEPLRAALREASEESQGAALRRWRVLMSHIAADGSQRFAAVDAAALQATGKGVVAVVRIEGQLQRLDPARLRAAVLATVARARAQGLRLEALEIDHDCATARLRQYREFLQSLRAEAALAGLPLLITALPAWLGSRELPALWQQVDELTLQLHAVQNPGQGLFDPRLALRWAQQIEAIAEANPSPLRYQLALPTYSAQLRFDDFGNLLAVESETPLLGGAVGSAEWAVDPQQLQDFVHQALPRARPRLSHLQGLVWFRLPTLADQRAWHPATWRRVMSGAPLQPALRVQAQADASTPGLYRLQLVNSGRSDALWPSRLNLPADCGSVQGRLGYRSIVGANGGWHLQRAGSLLLKPGASSEVAWLRCSRLPVIEIHENR
ncbi:DUF3142 domain-containing protein [Paucibacter sp. KBW04]|uniref:DUF3142 domain-containing protein n=1 Tax=Paucibacter sp. KBW04 TaxID=2153361 RepID=UPI000F57E319|nr:DUF3142 domain-containing protein [Paucibacter sp. KBW04]RQO55612.1 DUF3142 domain-containing protein [Paucibacter sp. KBW04]